MIIIFSLVQSPPNYVFYPPLNKPYVNSYPLGPNSNALYDNGSIRIMMS